MSKEQNLSSPVKDFNSHNATTSLPPLPDDFLSFQPQSSTHNDDGNGAAYTTTLDNVGQEQQRGSYRGGGSYYNKERNNKDRYSKKKGYHDGYQKHYGGGGGGGDKYHSNSNYRSYRPPKGGQRFGGQQFGKQRGKWNNYTSPKKHRVYEADNKDVDISLYYKKSFVEDPWADLMKN